MRDTWINTHLHVAEKKITALPVSEGSYNLFQEPWWLDAVASGEWEEVVVKRRGHIAARLPYVRRKILGRTWLLQPKLTPYLGPWLRFSKAKFANQIAEQKELMLEVIDQLPQFDLFRQSFAPEITYWLPFYWRGFRQTARYTYRLSDLADLAEIWRGVRHNIRNEIRKAKKNLVVRNDLDIDCLARIWSLSFARQGIRMPVGMELVHRIDRACEEHNCRRMFFAEDALGKIHASAYLVWNADCAYYLMGGVDPDMRSSGAGSFVVWEAIRFASTVTRQFDFEGSMIEPVERFFRGFGAKPMTFSNLSKLIRPMQFLAGFYHAGSALLGRNPVI